MLLEILMVILFNKYLISFACKLCGKLLQIYMYYHYTERVLEGLNVELSAVKCTVTKNTKFTVTFLISAIQLMER